MSNDENTTCSTSTDGDTLDTKLFFELFAEQRY